MKDGITMSQSTIVLIILGIFIVSLLMNKWSFGITGITTCILLFLFYYKGDIGAAFSGLTNQVIFLMVGMYGLSAAFARTSLLKKMQEILNSLQGKKGIFLVLCIFGVAFLFGNFFPSAVTVSLMMTFVATLGNENAISSDRLCVPIAGIAGMSMGVLPMGSALVSYTAMNAFYEGMITDARQLVTMWDPFKMGIPMFLFGFIWCLIGYKIQPQKGRAILSTTKKNNGQKKSAASKAPLSKRDETIVYLCFGGTMIALFLSNQLGNFVYGVPIIADLILLYTKAIPNRDMVLSVCSPTSFMVIGILSMSNALGASGAGEILGNAVLKLMGSNPSPMFAFFVVMIATVIMTSLMSNIATNAVLCPIVAAMAIAAGWNPVPFVIVVRKLAWCAILLPSGSSACAMAHATSEQLLSDSLKFSVPFVLFTMAGAVVSVFLFFPNIGGF